MRKVLLAVAVVFVCQQAAQAYWPTIGVTREKAAREKLPLAVTVTPLGDGTFMVKYEVTLTGPFAHLSKMSVLAADRDGLLLQVPVASPPVRLPTGGNAGGERDGPETVTGTFRVSEALLGKCRLTLDCPVEPLNESGQTFSVDVASFLKK